MKKLLIILTTLFVCIITITSGIYVGYRHPEWLGLKKSGEVVKVRINTGNRTGGLTTDSAQYQEIDFSAFWDAWDIIRTRHVNRPGDTNELIYGAINGMLQYGFNDQFSSFLPPLINEVASEDLSGSFSGVGIELEMIQGKVTVVAPLSGTPGEKAGILSGDIITAIDGEVIDGLTLLEAVRKIRGPSGTDVVLSISRALDTGEIKDFDQTITRGTVDVKSVDWEAKDNGIYVIKIRNFAGDTNREWDAAVAEIAQKSPQGIVLDLRNNAGGYVNSAVHIISEFVPSGVAVTEDFGGKDREDLRVTGQGKLFNIPVMVLTNKGTASASEMLAGALQDTGRGKLIGVRTFGKGVLQEIFDVKVAGETEDASVRIVTARWYTPNGTNVEYKGLSPDIEVKTTIEQYDAGVDPVMDKAMELLGQ